MAELIAGMMRTSRYKRSQGRIARQVTFIAIAATMAIGAWLLGASLSGAFGSWFGELHGGRLIPSQRAETVGPYAVFFVLSALGAWAAFRIVNIPSFADFLISVEAEMNKVTWPSRAEVYRASLVVIVVIFLLVAILFVYDVVLKSLVNLLLGD